MSKYPNLSKVLTELIVLNYEDLKSNLTKDKKISNLSNDDKIRLSKWGHQLLILRLYTDLMTLNEDYYLTKENYLENKTLEKELYSKIDPSIRLKLKNKGLSLIQNIYSGYDSEYKEINANNNRLLSVQLAVNTKTLLKLPNNKGYSLSKLNALTDDVYEISGFASLDLIKLEEELNKCINKLRVV